MRRYGFTLIELIITIVIMAGIFAVIPKILSVSARNDTFAMQQDALMQAVSFSMLASRMSWDENNTLFPDILQTQSSVFACDLQIRFRPGSYISAVGRMCEHNISATLHPGAEADETDVSFYDDIDDFNGTDIRSDTHNGKQKYLLTNRVTYLTDTVVTDDNGTDMTIDLSLATPSTTTTSLKYFSSKVRYVGARGRERNISSFSFCSANIGAVSIAYREWQ